MVTLEFAVLVLPRILSSQRLHHVPVLRDLSVLDTEQIIVGGGSAAEGALTDCQTIVTISQNIVSLVVDHLDALLGKSGQRSAKTG